MCGIHGFVNGTKPELNSDDFIKQGCIAGMLRGDDSTGVAVVDTSKLTLEVRKLPLPGNFFAEDKVFNGMLSDIRKAQAITIAHTRAATVGKVAEYTAHPFSFWDEETGREMVGVHNGTLTNWRSHKGASKYDVDSNWALDHIFEYGIDAFKSFTGAYCFVWWDSETPNILNIARNDQRSMHVAFTESGGLAYASEAGMLAWLADRNRIKLDGSIKELGAGKHFQFDLTDIKKVVSTALPTIPTAASVVRSHGYNSYVSAVDKVDAFLKKVMDDEVKASPTVSPEIDTTALNLAVSNNGEPKPNVTRMEVADAKSIDVLGKRVKFTPSHTDNHSSLLYGTVSIDEDGSPWDADAIIRNASGVEWSNGDVFDTIILGATLSVDNILIIASKPRVSLAVVGDANKSVAVN